MARQADKDFLNTDLFCIAKYRVWCRLPEEVRDFWRFFCSCLRSGCELRNSLGALGERFVVQLYVGFRVQGLGFRVYGLGFKV